MANNKKIIAISDVEGFEIKCPGCTNGECTSCENTVVYICGDMLDSTSAGNNELLKLKNFNLRNIHKVISNPEKYKLILGNRDINKIKCKVLNKLNGNTTEINNFNNGNIGLDENKYTTLKEELRSTNDPWFAPMKHWYTFWSPKLGEGKNWSTPTSYAQGNLFLTRFNEIFGVDNNIGTMSAQNLLESIYSEVITNTNKSHTSDYKAFVVLAIFKSMLYNNDNIQLNEWGQWDNLNKLLSSSYNGWLCELYNKSSVCKLEIKDNNVYLFSHGGVPFNLVNDSNANTYLTDLNLMSNMLTDATNIKQKGGSSKKNIFGGSSNQQTDIISKSTPLSKLESRIELINKQFKDEITSVLDYADTQTTPTSHMLFLLAMSAPFNCETFKTKLDSNLNSNLNCGSITNTELYSPILPGLALMRKPENNFFIEGNHLYQIFGHKPVGFGTTIDLFKNNQNKTYLINLDTSNSFRTSNDNDVSNLSYNYITINVDGTVVINTKIKFHPIKFDNNKHILSNSNKDFLNNQLIYSTNNSDINIENTIDELNEFISKVANKNPQINVHGITNDKLNVFSVNGAGFSRSLFVLNETDLNTFLGTTPPTATTATTATTVTTVATGGSYNYTQKYLKYKEKYLKLKNQFK